MRHADADARTLALAVQRVPEELVSRYGIVEPSTPAGEDGCFTSFAIQDIVEKPSPAQAPSRFAASARYVFPFAVFDALRRSPLDASGELSLTDALRQLLARGHTGIAEPLAAGESRHDIGGFDSYYRAFVLFALADGETGAAFRRDLSSIMTEHKEHDLV